MVFDPNRFPDKEDMHGPDAEIPSRQRYLFKVLLLILALFVVAVVASLVN